LFFVVRTVYAERLIVFEENWIGGVAEIHLFDKVIVARCIEILNLILSL
jgi:hypothetical protein